jgi:hypothetical protein
MVMPDFIIWSGFATIPEMTGLQARIIGATEQRAMMDSIRTLVNSDLDTALAFVPGFNPREQPPPVELGSSNLKGVQKASAIVFKEVEFHLAVFEMKFEAMMQLDIGEEKAVVPGKGIGHDLVIGSKCVFGIEARVYWKEPWFADFGLEFEVGGKAYLAGPNKNDARNAIEIKAFVAVGIGRKILWGRLGVGFVAKFEDFEWQFGGMVLADLEVDLEVVVIKVSGELIGIKKHHAGHDLLEYEGEVAINVKVAAFISIELSLAVEGEEEFPKWLQWLP